MSDDGGTRVGLPAGLGAGPDERHALLLLRCLRGIRAHDLTRLLWEVGTASAALDAIRCGRAGSHGDRAFLTTADAARITATIRACGARFVIPGEAGY